MMARLTSIIAIIGIALMCVFAQELYSDKYDSIDVPAILANDRLRNQYFDCFMNGPCVTADAKFFKDIIFESLATNCARCTNRQKEMMVQLSDWYTKNDPDNWNKLLGRAEEVKNAGR